MQPVTHTPQTRNGLLAAGNWLIDHVKIVDHWPQQDALANILSRTSANGGGPYNVLKDLAKLHAPFPLSAIGLTGHDADGATIRADCAAHNIDTTQLHTTQHAPTSYTDVIVVRDTGRRTFFHARGANAHLAPTHFDFQKTTARWFYLGYLLLLDSLDAPDPSTPDHAPHAREILRRSHAAGLLNALDCVSAAPENFRKTVLPVLPEVDVLFANDYEAEQLTNLPLGRGPTLNRKNIEAAARQLLSLGVRRYAIIHFPEGACAVDTHGNTHWQPSVRVPQNLIAGAAGAGDAFAAGCLLAIHENQPLPAALQLGVCAAATSLLSPTCSDSIPPSPQALAFGNTHGYHALP